MNDQAVMILAGIFTVSNLGHPKPSVEEVVRVIKHPPESAYDSVCRFAAQYMESEYHEKVFAKEAEGWEKIIRKDGERQSRVIHHDIWELYDAAVKQAGVDA